MFDKELDEPIFVGTASELTEEDLTELSLAELFKLMEQKDDKVEENEDVDKN